MYAIRSYYVELRPGILSVRQRLELDLGRTADALVCRSEVVAFLKKGDAELVTTKLDDTAGHLLVNGRSYNFV